MIYICPWCYALFKSKDSNCFHRQVFEDSPHSYSVRTISEFHRDEIYGDYKVRKGVVFKGIFRERYYCNITRVVKFFNRLEGIEKIEIL